MKRTLTALSIAAMLALSGCSTAEPAVTPTVTTPTSAPAPVAEPASTPPTATGVPTSGSYADDVLALGIKPDDMRDYADWMKERICDQDRIGLGVAVRGTAGKDVASGGGPEVVRLTVSYFCPEKSQEVETALEYFNQ